MQVCKLLRPMWATRLASASYETFKTLIIVMPMNYSNKSDFD